MNHKTNTDVVFSMFWISHFLIWSFGDFLSQLQKLNEPAPNQLLIFVAVPLGILQTFMIIYPHFGKPKIVRTANLFIPLIFIVFNIGYLFEATFGWQYLLGFSYLALNFLVVRYAWIWKKS